jgi:hypothetical protein
MLIRQQREVTMLGKIKRSLLKKVSHSRRNFLKLAGLSSAGLSMGFPLNTKWAEASGDCLGYGKEKIYWKTDPDGNRYFVQDNLMTGPNPGWPNSETNPYILARYDRWWNAFPVREFDDDFHDWWIEEKNWYYQQLIDFFEGKSDELGIPNGGHHHPMLATDSRKLCSRGDSQFHLNCTPKGFTIIPKAENIQYIADQVQEIYDLAEEGKASLPVDLFKLRQSLYADKSLWDKTKFATLELYSGRPIDAEDPSNEGGIYGFNETHTFQNLMVNPMATLAYMSLWEDERMGIPTFEFRGFCWLISNYNPNITEYEKAIHDYINLAHCGYHGGSCVIATNLFVITEEFNNTPGYDPIGRGKRVVPPPEPGLYDLPEEEPMSTVKNTSKKKMLTKDEKLELLKRRKLLV